MNPPCVGDEATCGKNFTRAVGCYQVPSGFTFGPGWTTASGVKSIDMAYCPDVASTPAYDASSGVSVPRGTDGKLVVSTTCGPCNFAEAVQGWVSNSCPCVKTAGDYCNYTNGVGPNGFCHSDGTTPCNATNCPKPAQAAMQRQMQMRPSRAAKRADRKTIQEAKKAQAARYYHMNMNGRLKNRMDMMNMDTEASKPCDPKACDKACVPRSGKGHCTSKGCMCLSRYAPSYALPSQLNTTRY